MVKRCAVWIAHWFTRYPFLGIVALLFLGVLAFNVGAGLGLPGLFWLTDAGHKLRVVSIGMSTSVVFALICVVGFFLESEKDPVEMREYVIVTYVPMAVILLIGTIAIASRNNDQAHPLLLLLGHAIGIVICAGIGEGLSRLAKRISPPAATPNRRVLSEAVTGNRVWVHVFATLITSVLAVVYLVLAIFLPLSLPAAVAICVLFATALMVYGFIRFQLPRERVVVFVLLVAVAGCSSYVVNRKHRFPCFDYRKENLVTIRTPPLGSVPSLISQETALRAWLSRVGPAPKPPLVIVTTSGGGIRAAVWTSAVLDALSRNTTFSQHVRLITGASGGMVGAAYWVSSLQSPETAVQLNQAVEAHLPPMAENSLDPVASALVLRDLPGLLLPWSFRDRGVALERSWEEHGKEAMKRTFGSLAAGEREGWRPSIVFTPMLVEDGRRLYISNTDLSGLTVNVGSYIDKVSGTGVYSRPAVQLLPLIPSAQKMSLATAARMSASFPWVSPAAELPTIPRRHVVDAGYWDDFGVNLATTWIEQNLGWLRANTSGVIVVQIRDTSEEQISLNVGSPSSAPVALQAYDELLAPIFGSLQTRHAIMIFHNNHDLALLSQSTGGFVETTVLESPGSFPLSWALTESDARKILDYFDQQKPDAAYRRVQLLRQRFATPAPPSP